MARYLLWSIRQNANSFNHRLSLLRCFRLRLVRCQTLWIHSTQESFHRCILPISCNHRHQTSIPSYFTNRSIGEYINHRMKALLEEHLTNHVVCAKDEHYSVGAAETAVNNLRHSARAMMLHGNLPTRFWHFAIAHATYLHNVISPSRADKSKTIFELLFDKKAWHEFLLTAVSQPYTRIVELYKMKA